MVNYYKNDHLEDPIVFSYVSKDTAIISYVEKILEESR